MLKIVHTDTLQHPISGTFLQQNESRPFKLGSLIAMAGFHSALPARLPFSSRHVRNPLDLNLSGWS